MSEAPSGEQFEITWRDQRATVVEVGGGVRLYEVDRRPVLDPYPIEAMCDGAHGAPLVPWPNRLGDGRYCFDGEEFQVALSEPEKNNAIHGLLRWRSWRALRRSATRVAMTVRLSPMPGYPFTLDVVVEYALGVDGLSVTTTATNVGSRRCPYGAGQHPYLSAGGGLVDECTLRLDAATRIVTDEHRQLPVGRESVVETPYDFRHARLVSDTRLDDPFTDLARDASGSAWVCLARSDGTTAALWVDEGYPIVEIYSGDTLVPARRRRGLGAEPMTCPPNAFYSGDGVVTLEPRESMSTTWGVQLR